MTPLKDGYFDSFRGMVNTRERADNGRMNVRFHTTRASDGSGHMWQGLGMDRQTMFARRRGRAVPEQRLTSNARSTAKAAS